MTSQHTAAARVSFSEKQAGEACFEIISQLPTPRHAARALAIANVLLIEQAECPDIRSADQCARMMDEMKAAVIENWTHRDAIAKTGGAA